ncbi:MAG: hypothetical protein FWE02_02945 [Defluviitaleaceae bacterium]|nr:hypothetical protein [Defluviitaleaceae bacterium]
MGEYIDSIGIARNSLKFMILALNIINGVYVFRDKWAYVLLKKYYNDSGYHVDKYYRFNTEKIENEAVFLKEIFEYTQEIKSYVEEEMKVIDDK